MGVKFSNILPKLVESHYSDANMINVTAFPGTKNNRERSDTRNDLALSKFVRRIPDVRHCDIDLFQVDTKGRFEWFCEATSTKDHKASTYTRALAQATGAYTMLLRHAYNDIEHEHPIDITVWDADGKRVMQETGVGWDRLEYACNRTHELLWSRRENLS